MWTEVERPLRALNNKTRFELVLAITRSTRPPTVNSLAKRVGIRPSVASGHLRILRENDLVVMQRAGQTVLCYFQVSKSLQTLVEMLEEVLRPVGLGLGLRSKE